MQVFLGAIAALVIFAVGFQATKPEGLKFSDWMSVGSAAIALLALYRTWRAGPESERRQGRGLLLAVRSEIVRGSEMFNEFRDKNIRGAPAWRLPNDTWTAALPFLSGSQLVLDDEAATISRFFDTADQFNYCLDDLVGVAGTAHAVSKLSRAKLKVSHALDVEPPHDKPLTLRALAAVDAAIARVA